MLGVRRFRVSSHELRILIGKFFALGNSYWLTRFVILRLLGFVYAIAFLVAAKQLVPLIGAHGLTPATHFLNEVQTQLGSRSAGMLRVPTLFWFGISDDALSIFSWVGFVLSLVVLCGYANAVLLTVLWAIYMIPGSAGLPTRRLAAAGIKRSITRS